MGLSNPDMNQEPVAGSRTPGGVIDLQGFPFAQVNPAVNPLARSQRPASDDPSMAANYDAPAAVLSLLQSLAVHLPMILQNDPADTMRMLRAALPFIPIMQKPLYNCQVYSDGINAIDIIVPDKAVLVKFGANCSFVTNFTGKAKFDAAPLLAGVQVTPDQNYGSINMVDAWYYVGATQTISVLSLAAPGYIGASFMVQL